VTSHLEWAQYALPGWAVKPPRAVVDYVASNVDVTQKDPEAEPVKLPSPSGRGAEGDPVKLPSPSGRGVGGEGRGAFEPDSDLRDFENVRLKDDIDAYYEREVRPHVPDAWMDRTKDKIGYEINFNRHFYKYTPLRPLEAIDIELKQAEEEIMRLLREVTE